MEVSCINKNAVNHTTNRSFIKAQQMCFSSAVESPFNHTPRLYQHVTNLQGDIRDLLAKSHSCCKTSIPWDTAQQILAKQPRFRASFGQNYSMNKAQHRWWKGIEQSRGRVLPIPLSGKFSSWAQTSKACLQQRRAGTHPLPSVIFRPWAWWSDTFYV